jgi:hypothetical protein
MTVKVFENMLKAIDDGKSDLVRERMKDYKYNDAQLKTLNSKLKN